MEDDQEKHQDNEDDKDKTEDEEDSKEVAASRSQADDTEKSRGKMRISRAERRYPGALNPKPCGSFEVRIHCIDVHYHSFVLHCIT